MGTICDVCGSVLASKPSLCRHRKHFHPEVFHKLRHNAQSNIICLEDKCHFGALKIQDLRDHLTQIHGFQFTEIEKPFYSVQEFEEWKARVEASLQVNFVAHRGVIQRENFQMAYYYCNRSGNYNPNTHRNRKWEPGRQLRAPWRKGSAKLERFCTASMKVRILEDGQVQMRAVVEHYGHSLDIQHLRTPKMDTSRLVGSIMLEEPSEELYAPVFEPQEDIPQPAQEVLVEADEEEEAEENHFEKRTENDKNILEANLVRIKALLEQIPEGAELSVALELADRLESELVTKFEAPMDDTLDTVTADRNFLSRGDQLPGFSESEEHEHYYYY